ncbi:PREDICTED: uncharacterized protein LOC104821561 [Tarenaya hassleriana]|uniref:uncharacterized protein LOC104821561 n=1 Tax=Tarenaya hassleriana TaxID=28532 RepID=UPI0008FCFF36|nr:PREDICTED: uncharacterized protein LOC104821561 [Tarenaya hassleriana]
MWLRVVSLLGGITVGRFEGSRPLTVNFFLLSLTGRRAQHQDGDKDANILYLKVILGSQSMARKRILAEMGYDFSIMTADIDEKSIRKEKPEDLVMALAEAKADAITKRFGDISKFLQDTQPTLLITADTVSLRHRLYEFYVTNAFPDKRILYVICLLIPIQGGCLQRSHQRKTIQ